MAGLQENVQFIPLGAGVQSDGHPLAAQPPLMSEQQNMTATESGALRTRSGMLGLTTESIYRDPIDDLCREVPVAVVDNRMGGHLLVMRDRLYTAVSSSAGWSVNTTVPDSQLVGWDGGQRWDNLVYDQTGLFSTGQATGGDDNLNGVVSAVYGDHVVSIERSQSGTNVRLVWRMATVDGRSTLWIGHNGTGMTLNSTQCTGLWSLHRVYWHSVPHWYCQLSDTKGLMIRESDGSAGVVSVNLMYSLSSALGDQLCVQPGPLLDAYGCSRLDIIFSPSTATDWIVSGQLNFVGLGSISGSVALAGHKVVTMSSGSGGQIVSISGCTDNNLERQLSWIRLDSVTDQWRLSTAHWQSGSVGTGNLSFTDTEWAQEEYKIIPVSTLSTGGYVQGRQMVGCSTVKWGDSAALISSCEFLLSVSGSALSTLSMQTAVDQVRQGTGLWLSKTAYGWMGSLTADPVNSKTAALCLNRWPLNTAMADSAPQMRDTVAVCKLSGDDSWRSDLFRPTMVIDPGQTTGYHTLIPQLGGGSVWGAVTGVVDRVRPQDELSTDWSGMFSNRAVQWMSTVIPQSYRLNRFRELDCISATGEGLSGRIAIPGGMLSQWDGEKCQQLQFLHGPGITAVVTGSGPQNPGGVQTYCAVYERIDKFGNRIQSQPGNQVTVNTAVGDNVALRAEPYSLSEDVSIWGGDVDRIRVVWYQSDDGGQLFTRVTPDGIGTQEYQKNVPSHWPVLSPVMRWDAGWTNAGTEPLYTLGGGVECSQIGCTQQVLFHQNRLIAAGGADRIWVSKLLQPGTAPQWSRLLTVGVGGSQITAAASTGTVLYMFTDENLYAVQGEGPDDLGGGGYTSPQRLDGVPGLIGNSIPMVANGTVHWTSGGNWWAAAGLSAKRLISPLGWRSVHRGARMVGGGWRADLGQLWTCIQFSQWDRVAGTDCTIVCTDLRTGGQSTVVSDRTVWGNSIVRTDGTVSVGVEKTASGADLQVGDLTLRLAADLGGLSTGPIDWDSDGNPVWIDSVATTAPVSFGMPGGWNRLWWSALNYIQLTGAGREAFSCTFSPDTLGQPGTAMTREWGTYDGSALQQVPDPVWMTGAREWRHHHKYQQCRDVQLSYRSVKPSGWTVGQDVPSVELIGWTLRSGKMVPGGRAGMGGTG